MNLIKILLLFPFFALIACTPQDINKNIDRVLLIENDSIEVDTTSDNLEIDSSNREDTLLADPSCLIQADCPPRITISNVSIYPSDVMNIVNNCNLPITYWSSDTWDDLEYQTETQITFYAASEHNICYCTTILSRDIPEDQGVIPTVLEYGRIEGEKYVINKTINFIGESIFGENQEQQ